MLKKLNFVSSLFVENLLVSIGALSKDSYYFNLLNNRIIGEIPESIGKLSCPVCLTLWDHFLDGRIPSTFEKLQQLQRLYLGRNGHSGPIPEDMGNMDNPGLLDVSDNLINGSIPSTLGNLSKLRYLYLSGNHNRLSGTLPLERT